MLQFLTVNGVHLVNWYRMGITDVEDLQWLLRFYHNENYNQSQTLGALMMARRYMESRGL